LMGDMKEVDDGAMDEFAEALDWTYESRGSTREKGWERLAALIRNSVREVRRAAGACRVLLHDAGRRCCCRGAGLQEPQLASSNSLAARYSTSCLRVYLWALVTHQRPVYDTGVAGVLPKRSHRYGALPAGPAEGQRGRGDVRGDRLGCAPIRAACFATQRPACALRIWLEDGVWRPPSSQPCGGCRFMSSCISCFRCRGSSIPQSTTCTGPHPTRALLMR
jgi:hypothetical protein